VKLRKIDIILRRSKFPEIDKVNYRLENPENLEEMLNKLRILKNVE